MKLQRNSNDDNNDAAADAADAMTNKQDEDEDDEDEDEDGGDNNDNFTTGVGLFGTAWPISDIQPAACITRRIQHLVTTAPCAAAAAFKANCKARAVAASHVLSALGKVSTSLEINNCKLCTRLELLRWPSFVFVARFCWQNLASAF